MKNEIREIFYELMVAKNSKRLSKKRLVFIVVAVTVVVGAMCFFALSTLPH